MLPSIFFRNGASGFSCNAPPLPFPPPSLPFVPTLGASSGIGVETARVLAVCGAHVVMAARNIAAADSVRRTVLADTPTATLDVMELDLSSMASVRKFAAECNLLHVS